MNVNCPVCGGDVSCYPIGPAGPDAARVYALHVCKSPFTTRVDNRALRLPGNPDGQLLLTALPFLDIPERDRGIIGEWLAENVTMKDLGKRHGIGAERIRQILARARRYSLNWRDGYKTGVRRSR